MCAKLGDTKHREVKLSMCHKHEYWGREVRLHEILISVLDRGESVAFSQRHITARQRVLNFPWIGARVEPKFSSDAQVSTKYLFRRDSNQDSAGFQAAAQSLCRLVPAK